MPIQVSYMGTKQKIAPHVAAIIADGPSGPLLDVFSGICAIGYAVAPQRQVWCNDIQLFASSVAKAFFLCPETPIHFDKAAEIASALYWENRLLLEKRFAEQLSREQRALNNKTYKGVAKVENEISALVFSDKTTKERNRLAENLYRRPYRLFSITFSGGYVGLKQAIQVDSIRYAVDKLREQNDINQHQYRWMNLALCQAVSKVSTTTGHFAQHMIVKQETLGRFVAQRTRSVWSEWLRAIFEFSPLGTRSWRSGNRVFQQEATLLLQKLSRERQKPATIYADPPYTSDHYSRYYHLYETLLRYDYPSLQGVGRYRPDRFASRFSTRSKVEGAIDRLVETSAKIGARLVLSYPAEGLLPDAEKHIRRMIKNHYGNTPFVTRIKHNHSSLGGSKGSQQSEVDELIFATR